MSQSVQFQSLMQFLVFKKKKIPCARKKEYRSFGIYITNLPKISKPKKLIYSSLLKKMQNFLTHLGQRIYQMNAKYESVQHHECDETKFFNEWMYPNKNKDFQRAYCWTSNQENYGFIDDVAWIYCPFCQPPSCPRKCYFFHFPLLSSNFFFFF